ncbi:ShlB/FhaC/HecB family hemolysin secretion/activation protein [uncultured Anaeromusa sp.]|uniref:ShlB/FhaC/HecB family hemolysin secretion/activation protein n=1 Tax=uncultured Anaeromusa sp. TaxID=673273 RepID=UPI0029C68390|nr:ShlB/FhaC/HecB family hemolysin secretion/activation protein [uncultured Anaeromusa sp.]
MKNNTLHRFKQILGASLFCLMAADMPAFAAVPPTSGTLLDGVKPPPQQVEQNNKPSVTIQQDEQPDQSKSKEKIAVSRFRLSGELPLLEPELLSQLKRYEGRELTLDELNQAAGDLTGYLRRQGYLVAFAYLPAQSITDGVVEIAIVPGKYGELIINSAAHSSPSYLKNMLRCVKPGSMIRQAPLDRALLLLNDLSGIRVNASLRPGKTSGTADLVLEAGDTKRISGAIYSDNWGNPYSGRVRSGIELNVNNPGGLGDQLSLGAMVTENTELKNYNALYNRPLGVNGARLSISHSRMDYTLGDIFSSAGASGVANTDSASVSYPVVRSRSFNLSGSLGYDQKHMADDIVQSSSYARKNSSVWNAALTGNFSDNVLGGAFNSFSLNHYVGSLSLQDAATKAVDDATAKSAGHFSKTLLSYQRQQYLADHLDFFFSFTGQLANTNLDSSEKLYLGGASGVRAFSQGEAAGDQGYRLSGEFRWQLKGLSKGDRHVQLVAFYDYGSVMSNKNPWAGAGQNRRSLMGAGFGLRWQQDNVFSYRLDYAFKIGDEPSANDTNKNGRLWLQAVRYL